MKKIIAINLTLLPLLLFPVLSACNGNNMNPSGVMVITIGSSGGGYDVNTFVPGNEVDERVLAHRKQVLRDNNFIIREEQIGIWSELQQIVLNSIMSGQPAASVFILPPNWAMPLRNRGLLYPLSESKTVDFSPAVPGDGRVEWNQIIRNAFTVNGRTYAMSTEKGSGIVVFYNKRVFKEAGLDPYLPYIMQREGTWTWDAFFEICKILTRDIDNDGIIDRYALCTTPFPDFVDAIIASNGANYIERDPVTGLYVNATNRPEFIEALQYAQRLREEGVMKFPPPDATWSWHHPEFYDGTIAMRVEGEWIIGQLQPMKDDWGMVMFPRGPRSDIYRTFIGASVMVVPITYSPEEVDTILRAVELWYTPVDSSPID